jgi:hypothetical protein
MKNILFIATLLFAQFSLGQEDQMIPTNNQDEFPKFEIFSRFLKLSMLIGLSTLFTDFEELEEFDIDVKFCGKEEYRLFVCCQLESCHLPCDKSGV